MKKKSRLEKLMPFLIGTCLLTLVAACGSDDDDSGSGVAQQQEQQDLEGEFTAALTPVNGNVAGNPVGNAAFVLSGDEFRASLVIANVPNTTHRQYVYTGTRCPTAADDTDRNGYIDIIEATNAIGGALIPLDDDLTSQEAGGVFPQGTGYPYDEATSFQTMMQDLRLPDTNPNDGLVKLGADDPLNLHGKVVVIHGVPEGTALPETVKGTGDLSPHEALPILCGVFTRISTGGTATGTTTGGTSTGGTTGPGPGPGPGDCDGTGDCPNTTAGVSGM